MNDKRIHVLLVEDNPADARLVRLMLAGAGQDSRSGGFDVHPVERVSEALAALAGGDWHMILLDLSLPDAHGLEALYQLRAAVPHLPIVVMSGLADEEIAVQAVQEGAQDYLVKGMVEGALLVRAIRYAIERKQAEAALAAKNEELEQRVAERTAQLEAANQELEAFCYSVSHDLRAPLRAIDGFSRILLEDYAASLDSDAQPYLRRVCDNVHQMDQLIDDLLAFSRLGRQPVNKQVVLPEAIVRQALSELNEEVKGRQVEIKIHDLPECQADPALLKQVWFNLLSNALKYTRARETAVIEIGCREDNERPVYFVKDNGAGFDMQYAHKLFGVFQRLHRAEEFEGTGVGLAIVQRVVHRHGGRVWAEGEVDKGATLYFTV